MRRYTASMLAALAGAIGLSACSSGGSSALTKSEFAQQADAICKKYDDQASAALAKVPSNPTKDQKVALLNDALIPAVQGSHDEIAKLEPPKADKAQINKMLDDLQTGIDATKKQAVADPDAALRNPTAFDAATADANAYGLKECGSTSGDSSASSTP